MEAETCKKELVIEIPVDVVRREADTVTAQYTKMARIPGFRPGRAPASLIRNRFRDDIKSEVVQTLLPKFFETLVKDQKLSVVGQPHFDDLKFEDDKPLTVKATFEVYPSFDLKEYKGLEAGEDAATVADADIDQTLDKLRERAAAFEAVPDRPAQDDDYLDVSYHGRDVKDPESRPVEAREAMVHLGGKGTVAGFTENLRGTAPGEVREFNVTYPDDYPQKGMAGKTYHYRVEVRSIKKKVVPTADDDLAKTISEFSTLDELRNKIREDLKEGRQHRVEAETKQKLMEKLLAAHDFPVPQALVETQVDHKLENTLSQLLSQGIDPRTIDIDWKKIREDSRPDATREVQGSLILEKIAEAEKIEVTAEEVDEIIREMAQERRETPAALKTRLTRDGMLARIESSRRNQKALDLIYRSAKITRKIE
ncbi:MAG TPA: trigger factor [Terriglobia bacterium]|nr:trigger factor [Terriglobia bacterium]